jgi:very-short-patch-repair endonuclease
MQLRRDQARQLCHNQTETEHKLWMRLHNRRVGVKFRRQYRVGPYIADFCCVERLLVVELDGGQHAEQIDKDERRTAYLTERGFRVVRFWNHQVLTETAWVVEEVFRHL